MKQLSENQKQGLIELAKRGVDGERENARKILERHGINWDENITWQTIDIEQISEEICPTWVDRIRVCGHIKSVSFKAIHKITGQDSFYLKREETGDRIRAAYFYGTTQQREEIIDAIKVVCRKLVPKVLAILDKELERADFFNYTPTTEMLPPEDEVKRKGMKRVFAV
jgi:hypothetical protein